MQSIRNALSSSNSDVSRTDGRRSMDDSNQTNSRGITGGKTRANRTGSSSSSSSSDDEKRGTRKSKRDQLPVNSGVEGRSEETESRGTSRTVGGRHAGDFTDPHDHGHSRSDKIANEFDPRGATTTHHHTHLAHKTQETRVQHEVEEVERLKDHERHVTHVQHHVQPVKDTEHLGEVHQQREVPQTHIEERHISSDQDKRAFAGLAANLKDTVQHAPKERTVVDLGEKVNETVHHHVHNVIQPVIHKDTHEHTKIHTVIPTHHVTHEAPIVHQSVEHGMLNKDDFLKQGGQLGSSISHDRADVLATGDCERTVEGVGEKLARELNLKSGTLDHQQRGDTRI